LLYVCPVTSFSCTSTRTKFVDVRGAGVFDSIPGESLCNELGLSQSSSNFTSQSEGHFNFIFYHRPPRPDQRPHNHQFGPHFGLRIRLGLIKSFTVKPEFLIPYATELHDKAFHCPYIIIT